MNKIKIFILISIMFLMTNVLLADSIKIRRSSFDSTEYVFSSQLYNYKWISLNHFFKTFGNDFSINYDNWTLNAKLKNHKITFYGGSAYYKIDDNLYHLPMPIERVGNGLYIPLFEFIRVLKTHFYKTIKYNKTIDAIILTPGKYSLGLISINELSNGTMINIEADTLFNKQHCKIWDNDGWLYFTIYGANIDVNKTKEKYSYGHINEVDVRQANESVQLSFKFRNKFSSYDFHINEKTNSITINVRKEKTKDEVVKKRSKWLIDTIVLDAGHGGKDPGTVLGRLHEKDIALDIVLQLGKMLENNLGVKVVYTRKTDKFIPLWKRPQIANANNGKLFVSVHVNGVDNSPGTYGTETYLLAPRGTKKAIEIAAKENSVIQLEKNQDRYKNMLSPQQYILATMAQREFMKESLEFAQLVESNYSNRLTSKSRGLRQAGFIVLIGASMPSILTEVGFITNKKERNNLAKYSYRKKIATSLYDAILKFKTEQDKKINEIR